MAVRVEQDLSLHSDRISLFNGQITVGWLELEAQLLDEVKPYSEIGSDALRITSALHLQIDNEERMFHGFISDNGKVWLTKTDSEFSPTQPSNIDPSYDSLKYSLALRQEEKGDIDSKKHTEVVEFMGTNWRILSREFLDDGDANIENSQIYSATETNLNGIEQRHRGWKPDLVARRANGRMLIIEVADRHKNIQASLSQNYFMKRYPEKEADYMTVKYRFKLYKGIPVYVLECRYHPFRPES